ncbi:guanylate-binding protein 1 isoform X3 [Ictalurus punctatus]|uniref:Guanylate-binding protein 1 isoform X3 n=1 Tax=Ictalurus punctatus TaxID=7998 RepID=A0A979FES4_ICTPU|nr:guanylate-binding protein 1 isoform X3 [Ictalurus punctatus]
MYAAGVSSRYSGFLPQSKDMQGLEITMCSPMPEPICLVENVNGSLRVSDAAIEYLYRINQPVVVVSVVGLYRTGKSYLMNRLAGKQAGFALGSTIESKTKGIWMWCVPHPHNTGHTLVLLDTEGLGDVDKGDSTNDAWIFCLAVLLSSTLVYNSRGTIDNTAVEQLHYVTELAEQIKIKSPASRAAEEKEEEEDAQFVQFFPNFIWAVRDFSLELVIDEKGQVTENEYLDFALQLKKGLSMKTTNYNLPRQCIRNYFPTRKCFVFPFPASQDKMVQLESLHESEIWPKFLNVTQHFCDYVFTASKVKTVTGGYRVTGRMFGHLVQSYVETISSGKVPCLENAVVVMARIENEAAVQEGLELYTSGMEQVKSLFPVDLNKLSAEHKKISKMANTEFIKHSFKDEEQEYFKKLMEAVNKHYVELIAQNMEASEQKCQQILSDLFEEMNVRVQRGEYAKPGGYKLYCTQRDNVITQYHSQPNKGIQRRKNKQLC